VLYFTFKDRRVEGLAEVVVRLRAASATVGELYRMLLDYDGYRQEWVQRQESGQGGEHGGEGE
jgi:hypothetical protein